MNAVAITPAGHLTLRNDRAAPPVDADISTALANAAQQGSGATLLALGLSKASTPLPARLAWWRAFAQRYLTALCTITEDGAEAPRSLPPPDDATLTALAMTAPPMDGAEYVHSDTLHALWLMLHNQLRDAAAAAGSLSALLSAHNVTWSLVGRVCLHLAENRDDEEAPFALMATYSRGLSALGRAQHVPLGHALTEYAAAGDTDRLSALITPLTRAAAEAPWLQTLLDSREIFHPLRQTIAEALAVLNDVPVLEQAGVVVRLPAAWRRKRPARAVALATVGAAPPSAVGMDALLDFRVDVAVDGEPLTDAEVKALLDATDGLALLRGQWVEIDASNLNRTLDRLRAVEAHAAATGLGIFEAMRILSGASADASVDDEPTQAWSSIVAGPWLSEALAGLRGPDGLADVQPGPSLRATLRPYQQVGLRWLALLSKLRLGACLADDMGLGKTIQVIALLLVLRQDEGTQPNLLVAPASLLSNWAAEIERFAPSLRVFIAHPSAVPSPKLTDLQPSALAAYDLVITSYGSLHRYDWTSATPFRLAIYDEAQAIKNPSTRQTKAAKKVRAGSKIALTGTPVENRVGDLWSLFDVINPGLLGSAKAFAGLTKRMASSPGGYAPLRNLVQPYLLRRLKTDKTVISDLPDKTEVKAFCALSRTQAALYQQAVTALERDLEQAVGMQRRGLVLSYLMRFKQLCNHPSQLLGDGAWREADSGKLARLREIAEVIAAKQEKVLVFTQFREITEPLAALLGDIFGRPGLVLTGTTAVKKRKELVSRFQEDDNVPFFVLSLKAGGSGLNLTAASHVIHFDRWWNPAVEDQATDRAFRIGQTSNVLVHKFICRGTIEEKIDKMITDKRSLSTELLAGSGEVNLTELSDDALLDLVRLDLNRAQAEV